MAANRGYHRILTGDNAIAAIGGALSITKLGFPAVGELRHLIVVDSSAAKSGYTVDIYSSAEAFDNPAAPTALGALAALYKVIPTQTVNASSAVMDLLGEFLYRNPDDLTGSPSRFLYLVITPSGSGAKTFNVNILISPVTTVY